MQNYSKIKKILQREPDPAFARRANIIFENLELKGKEKVLDFGCGRGFYLNTLKSFWPKLDLYGVDLNEKYLKVAKKNVSGKNINIIKGDVTNLAFTDNFFDRIIASEILEHVSDDNKAISEIYRVLKPGGIALITVPNKNYPFLWDPLNWTIERIFNKHIRSDIWWLAGIWADHVRLYDQKDLIDKIRKKAFKIEKVWKTTYYCIPFSHFLLYGIGKNLVEKGFFRNFNRFSDSPKETVINKIVLWPIRLVDELNERRNYPKISLNIIVKLTK